MPARPNQETTGTRRQVVTAHRRIETLLAAARAASESDLAAARQAFARLDEALETHFAQEAQLHYPPISALRPDRRELLEGFVEAHEGFRVQLADIRRQLDEGRLPAVRRALRSLAETFAAHEESEEDVLRAVEEEVAALKAD